MPGRVPAVARLFVALLAAATACEAAQAPEAPPPAATLPEVVHDCFHSALEPKRIVLACADFGLRARRLEWLEWGARKARARGTFLVNDCDPACVIGTFHRVRGRITLRDPDACKGLSVDVFTTGRVRLRRAVGGSRAFDVGPGCPVATP